MQIILASSSPRRHELLASADVAFSVLDAPIDESWQAGESAQAYIVRMVQTKADKACEQVKERAIVITADTIGVLDDGQVLTKPKDRDDAFDMWEKLSNKTHEIWTAVCVSAMRDGQPYRREHIICRTQVTFIKLTQTMKARYWATGEPVDKAGAYAIQGGAMAWVESISGSYTNVVGLPLAQTLQLIERMTAE